MAKPGVVQRHTNRCACGGSCPHCQAKSALKVGAPDDGHEREAEAVADRVVRMKTGDAPLANTPSSSRASEGDGARGIPMLLVDDVPLTGGGITVDPRFDTTYTGRSYFAIGINQTTTPNPACNHIAHELWHVGSGSSAHDPANGTISSCTGAGVTPTYCDGLRALA